MKELLKQLAESKLVRITGSYADGTQGESSDIDFYVKPNSPESDFGERNMLKIIKILKDNNIKWESNMVGYIHTHNVDHSLPIPMEFSDLFKPRKGRLKQVSIMGVKFKTY
jgi:predicted nucleotidyltransferase